VLVEHAHAKLNLSLAVTGRRADGFHDLVSLVATLALADHLALHPGQPLALTCDDPSLPVDDDNLVLKAARAYLRHRPDAVVGRFHLAKKIPHGAGLGGGSADAAAALRLLDRAAPSPLGAEKLEAIAAEVGSDCPYFVRGLSAVMRGRGERLEVLPEVARAALVGRRVLVIKPPFGVPTPEAYGLLAKAGVYSPAGEAEAALARWQREPGTDPSRLGNDLEAPVFRKYLALGTARDLLRERHRVEFRMTGSGSACFAFVEESFESGPIFEYLRTLWGAGTWSADTRISA
jgi:4-diphosphocytidyl-2-C-methyl-D-erythritol kinase